MRNILDESGTENQNAYFMFINFFPKIVLFFRQCGKTWYTQTGHWWQHNMVHALSILGNEGYKHTLRTWIFAFARQKCFANAPPCYVYTYIACLVSVVNINPPSLLYSDQMLLSLLHCLHLRRRKAVQCKMTVPCRGNFAGLCLHKPMKA
jgi:hypothetical protein